MIGLESLAKIQWLDAEHKFWALLFSYCFGMIGHHMLIWISGIERISKEYYEASGIDGANKVQQFFYMVAAFLTSYGGYFHSGSYGIYVYQGIWSGNFGYNFA